MEVRWPAWGSKSVTIWKEQWAQEMTEKKDGQEKCQTGMALWMSVQLVLVLQNTSAEFQPFVTELNSYMAQESEKLRASVGSWDDGRSSCHFLPMRWVSLSATMPMGYRMADASFAVSQIPQESPWSPAYGKHTRKGALKHVPRSCWVALESHHGFLFSGFAYGKPGERCEAMLRF